MKCLSTGIFSAEFPVFAYCVVTMGENDVNRVNVIIIQT